MMHRFVARENIRHLRERLASDIDPKTRAHITRLLVEEEDKLGADFELLSDLDRHIRNGHQRIAQQTVVVAALERDGHDGFAQAKVLLDALIEGQCLHERYRQTVLTSIEKNEL